MPFAAFLRPLTRGFRAHEPDVSPDGSQVVCAANLNNRARQLAIVSIDVRGSTYASVKSGMFPLLRFQ